MAPRRKVLWERDELSNRKTAYRMFLRLAKRNWKLIEKMLHYCAETMRYGEYEDIVDCAIGFIRSYIRQRKAFLKMAQRSCEGTQNDINVGEGK